MHSSISEGALIDKPRTFLELYQMTSFDLAKKKTNWFSLQSDSRRTLIWRAPGTRYHQENTIERHRYGGAGWLAFGEELFLVPELTCMLRM
ncbi:uncharacterized protein TNCV_3057331 [Trichonephila clavipes]|nr:uncharacterized protein TNCV_3057331 [Trichonephila clavipes]